MLINRRDLSGLFRAKGNAGIFSMRLSAASQLSLSLWACIISDSLLPLLSSQSFAIEFRTGFYFCSFIAPVMFPRLFASSRIFSLSHARIVRAVRSRSKRDTQSAGNCSRSTLTRSCYERRPRSDPESSFARLGWLRARIALDLARPL